MEPLLSTEGFHSSVAELGTRRFQDVVLNKVFKKTQPQPAPENSCLFPETMQSRIAKQHSSLIKLANAHKHE